MCSFPLTCYRGDSKCLCDEIQRLYLETHLDKKENVKNVSSKEKKIGMTAPEWIGSKGLQSLSTHLSASYLVFFPSVGTQAETLSFRINFVQFMMDKIIVTKGGWQMKGD